MHIIWTIIIGFLAGLVARIVTPGPGPSGFLITTALGIAGSLAATYIGQAVGWYQAGETAGFIAAVIGAAVLILLYRMFTRRSA
jgi:uncharacterized membrane protein YeaQ/YmgE (transglycosylase-associated protein family)